MADEDVRILESDDIEHGLNVRCLEISNQIEALVGWLDAQRPRYLNQSFDCGYIRAAQSIIEGLIDPDWKPMKDAIRARAEANMRAAIEASPNRST